jgi:hypothetical protein
MTCGTPANTSHLSEDCPEAREVADLGQQRRRRNKIDAAHSHQRRRTSASDHSGTASRIASSKRVRRSWACRIANIISSKTKRSLRSAASLRRVSKDGCLLGRPR